MELAKDGNGVIFRDYFLQGEDRHGRPKTVKEAEF
jgi:hypothetical protein